MPSAACRPRRRRRRAAPAGGISDLVLEPLLAAARRRRSARLGKAFLIVPAVLLVLVPVLAVLV